MANHRFLGGLANLLTSRTDLVALLTLLVAVIPRFMEATSTYLNPDEASYFTMGVAQSLAELHARSTATHHPPLLVFVLHAVSRFSHSELALRAVPILAGVAFPWFFYRWLGLIWNKTAGYIALLLLAFAPHLISLSAQARGYTLALLGISVSLYLLDRALREASTRWLLLSGLALYVAILSEYFAAFFAGGAGIYFLWRIQAVKTSRTFLAAWAGIQLGGVAVYALLYLTHIQVIAPSGSSSGARDGFLRHGFPWPETNAVVFLIKGVVKQATYIFASIPLGGLMLIPFAVGLWFLWRGQSSEDGAKTRPVTALALIPFALAASGSFLHAYPFLDSRHTVLLGVFVVLVASIALASVARSREWIVIPAALLLVPLWHSIAVTDAHNIGPFRHRKHLMVEAAEHLRQAVPPGSFILTDRETQLIIDYYLGPGPAGWSHRIARKPDWNNHFRIVSYRYALKNEDYVREDLARLRRDFAPGPEQDIWFLEGGWFYNLFESPGFQEFAVRERDFGRALALFRFHRTPVPDRPTQAARQ